MIIATPRPSGTSSRPDSSGEAPRTSWKYSGSNISEPLSVAFIRNCVATVAENVRLRNSRRSSSGRSVRSACRTNNTPRTAPARVGTRKPGDVRASTEDTPARP